MKNWPPNYLAEERKFTGDLLKKFFTERDTTQIELYRQQILQKREEFRLMWNQSYPNDQVED